MVSLGGRPTLYTPDLGHKICESVAKGVALQDVCKQPGMPTRRTVYYWLRTNDELSAAYELARANNGQAQRVAEWRDSNHDDLKHGLGGGSDERLRKGRTAAL